MVARNKWVAILKRTLRRKMCVRDPGKWFTAYLKYKFWSTPNVLVLQIRCSLDKVNRSYVLTYAYLCNPVLKRRKKVEFRLPIMHFEEIHKELFQVIATNFGPVPDLTTIIDWVTFFLLYCLKEFFKSNVYSKG